MYEHTYFNIFIMISFVANAYDSRTYLEYVLCFKPVWEGISFHFLTTTGQHESKKSL